MKGEKNTAMGLKQAFGQDNVAIVCSSDARYTPYLSTLICSIAAHTAGYNHYDIIVLEEGIEEDAKERMKQMEKENISIRFYDMSEYTKNADWYISDRLKWSDAVYYRMFIPYILQEYGKAVYLDCDVINLSDIAQMYQIDIRGYLVGAARLCGRVVASENGILNGSYIYHKQFLPEVDFGEYFNTGVLLMNLDEFRRAYTEQDVASFVGGHRYRLQDQDALNVLCAGRVKYIDSGWNWHPYSPCEFENILKLLPEGRKQYFSEGYGAPKNIHYTTRVKPWLEPYGTYAYEASFFWKHAWESPFIGAILEKRRKYQEYKAWSLWFSRRAWEELGQCAADGKLFLYGFGTRGREFIQQHGDIHIAGIIDKDKKKEGGCIPLMDLNELNKKEAGIVISNDSYEEIAEELREKGFGNLFSYRCLERRDILTWGIDRTEIDEVKYAGSMMDDKKSKELYWKIIHKREQILFDRNVSYADIYEGQTYYREDVYHIGSEEVYIDIGADGEVTIKKFKEYVRGRYKRIIAYNSDTEGLAILDDDERCREATFIRMNSGDTVKKINGAEGIIRRCRPKLAICVSNCRSDLWKVPILLKQLLDGYRIYIRHHSSKYDGTVLYAVCP